MAEYNPNPPSFPGVAYTAGTMDIGSGYAKGITAAGESISKGISSVMDTMYQNRKADDTLLAMNQSGILSDKAYQAVAGKSLGAKQTMLGMYASEWIAQQAQERELQKLGYQGNIELEKQRQALLDQYNLYKVREPGKFPVVPNQAQRAAPVVPPLGGTPGAPTPLGQADITNPLSQQPGQLSLIQGAPIGGKIVPQKDWQLSMVRGQPAYVESDQRTFHPLVAGTGGQIGGDITQR